MSAGDRGTFVGRAHELATLQQLCEHALRGPGPALAVVVGEPGVGKSRLLAELDRQGGVAELISMSGYEAEQRVPLAAARLLVRRVQTVPTIGATVATLVFGDTAARPAGRPSTAEDVEPVRLFEAVHRALAELGPAVVVVDDLHWVDDLSLALLHYVTRAAEAAGQPGAVVIATRPSARARRFVDSLQRVVGVDRSVELHLGPLDRQSGRTLALDLAPHLDREQAELAWARAEGSPFWLQLTAQSQDLDVDIEEVLRVRLRATTADVSVLLETLAIAGHPVTAEDIAHLHGWTTSRARQAADDAERHDLARATTKGVVVVHDLLRSALERVGSPGDARRRHRQFGRWLETSSGDGDDEQLVEALHHRRAGGDAPVGLALRIARGPRRRLLDAAGIGELLAVADAARADEGQAVELVEELAGLCADLGDHENALRLWSQRSGMGPPAEAGRAELRASQSALALGRRRAAWHHLHQARSVSAGDLLVIEVLAHEAVLQRHFERRLDEARAAATQSLARARAMVDAVGGVAQLAGNARRAYLVSALASADVARMGDDPNELLVLAEEVARVAAGFDDATEISALVQVGMALRFLGSNVEAEAQLRRAWERARHRVDPQAQLETGAALGRVLLSLGRISEARAVVSECSALGDRITAFRPGRTFLVTLPSLVELAAGDWQRGVASLAQSAASEREPHYRLHAHLEWAAAVARMGGAGADEVRSRVEAAMSDAVSSGCLRCLAEATVRSAEALARIGATAEAEELLAGVRLCEADLHTTFWRRRAQAALLAATDRGGEAVSELEGVVAEGERQGLHLEAVAARLDLGELLKPIDPAAAADVLRLAGSSAQLMGATTDVATAEQRLRALGVRTWRRTATAAGTGAFAGLTEREREIATMVAAGSSNPEIATALFLSRKTVERHVSNVLAKVGVRNRAELAALVSGLVRGSEPAPRRSDEPG